MDQSRASLASRQALPRLACRLGGWILGDDLFERTPCASRVACFDLTACDIEQRVRHFLAVRVRREQLPLRGDRRAEIALCVLRVTDPVQRRGRKRALRISADESLETRNC